MQSWRQGGGYEVPIRLPYPELTDWLALVAQSAHLLEVWVAAIGAGEEPQARGAFLEVLQRLLRGQSHCGLPPTSAVLSHHYASRTLRATCGGSLSGVGRRIPR